MSAYHLSPSPDLSTNEQNYATWDNGFSDAEISQIKQIGDSLAINVAAVNSENNIVQDLRQSQVGWIAQSNQTQFIYDKLGYIVRLLNGQFFNFDLYGFVEDFQYTIYNGGNDHYGWHMDKGNLGASPRKISVILQLSDPSEYEGGDLQFWIGGEGPITADKKKGLIYAFPSYILHRVTPVTRGTRKSLVVWIAGNKFK